MSPMENCKAAQSLSSLSNRDLTILSDVARSAAQKGGRILMKYYGNLNNIKSKSTVGDLVTEADLESEQIIVKFLQEETENIRILAEEGGLKGQKNDLCWCIDPLDGTTNFAHGYPFFATSIGLTWNDLPILGAISVPFFNELYWASPNMGAFCNENPIKVSATKSLINSLLVTGFAYDRTKVVDNNYAEFCWLTHRTRGVRRGGAAAVDLAFVAGGRLDGYWERGLSKWDTAAGVPIVELAGGVVSDYPLGNFNLNNGRIFASTPNIEKELKNELSKVIPLEGTSYGAP